MGKRQGELIVDIYPNDVAGVVWMCFDAKCPVFFGIWGYRESVPAQRIDDFFKYLTWALILCRYFGCATVTVFVVTDVVNLPGFELQSFDVTAFAVSVAQAAEAWAVFISLGFFAFPFLVSNRLKNPVAYGPRCDTDRKQIAQLGEHDFNPVVAEVRTRTHTWA